MGFNVGDVVRICEDDLLRGGQFAKILTVVESNCQLPTREYVVEFDSPPQRYRNEERFLFCVYREEQLVGSEDIHHATA